ncbi:MAG: methionine--tRNA ligase [Candidatus Woesearchaeota archaeon]
MVKHKILVTSALPYANGSIHLGHLVEYIQTDIFVRFLKLKGEDVIYCCADDTHGTAIEINAAKRGIKPEDFIAHYFKEHTADFAKYHILFDSYYSTNTPENKEYTELIFNRLKAKGYIYTKDLELTYCKKCQRFLPDRYVRGICPKCNAQDQYGDVCEKCNTAYKTTDLIEPRCAVCGSTPERRFSKNYFFKLSEFSEKLRTWLEGNQKLQPEVRNQVLEWIDKGLEDWNISRDGPYFGFKIPGEDNKYFYVWLDAPIGYIASTANYCKGKSITADDYWQKPGTQIVHFIGKDIIYFHLLFWPAVLMGADFNLPDYLVVHGFLTVNKEKMSKSRGTFLLASDFEKLAQPEFLRFYYAANLTRKLADVDLDLNDFREKINNELVANVANFFYRVLSFCNKNFDSKVLPAGDFLKRFDYSKVLADYENVDLRNAVKQILAISTEGNKYFQDNKPWAVIKEDRQRAHQVISNCVNLVKDLTILLKPILPVFADAIQEQLNLEKLEIGVLGKALGGYTINKAEIVIRKIEEPIKIEVKGKEVRDISFSLDPKVEALGLKVAVGLINGVKVKKSANALEKLKKDFVDVAAKYSKQREAVTQEFQGIFKQIGVDAETSAEWLQRHVKTIGKLPTINTLVDCYNIVSAKTMCAVGGHDLNKIKGNVTVRFAKDTDKYVELGGNRIEVPSNEYVYVDERGFVLCRLNTKQSEFTKVDETTQNVVIYVEGNRAVSDNELIDAAEEICKSVVRFCGGSYRILGEGFPLDLRVAKILEVKDHSGADKLVVLKIDLGTEQRTLVAGIKNYYTYEELVGRNIVVVKNLKPAMLRGIESKGMLLAAGTDNGPRLLEAPKSKPGDAVYFEGLRTELKAEVTIEEFGLLEIFADAKGVSYLGKLMKTDKEYVRADVTERSKVR